MLRPRLCQLVPAPHWPISAVESRTSLAAAVTACGGRLRVIYTRLVDKPELIRTIREAHQRVADAIEQVADGQLLQPVMDDWTGKDLLAHMGWWHDHSARVIEALREGREPYDRGDPANALDTLNERSHREHLDDPPELTRRAFKDSFTRLRAALQPVTGEELFAADHWPWLGGEALAETILWDTSRHYDDHREHLGRLSR